jgi:hypothetical protein
MSVPEHLWRFPTRAAIDALARRFGLPNTPGMQDWEWEVADPDRIAEFLAAYESGELSDDERFTLMETLLQSFEDLPEPTASDPRWQRTLQLLAQNVQLHRYSLWYWSDVGEKRCQEP